VVTLPAQIGVEAGRCGAVRLVVGVRVDHPIVTEITRRTEPVVHDTFGDPRPVLRPSWPAPKRRPIDA
jgi:hypothetical protein